MTTEPQKPVMDVLGAETEARPEDAGILPSGPELKELTTPYLRAGAEPISDTERLRLRHYKQNLDRVLALLAARQYDNAAANTILTNEGIVRWLEVGLPPGTLEEMGKAGRRYRFERSGKAEDKWTVYLPPGLQNGKDYTQPVGPATTSVELVGREEQHWWVLDLFKPERTTREFTGFCMKPKTWVSRKFLWNLHERRLWEPITNLATPLTRQQEFDILAAFADANSAAENHFFEYSEVVRVYEGAFIEAAQAAVKAGTVEKVEHYAKYFYIPFFTCGLIDFWGEFEKRYRDRAGDRKAPRSQTTPEAIAAKERAADLFSCVLKPLLTAENEATTLLEILWGTQDTRYENGDGIQFLRKIVDLIKDWYARRRAKAHQIFSAVDAKGSGDNWFAGLWDPFEIEHLKIPLTGVSGFPDVPEEAIERIYKVIYGWLAELGDEFLLPAGTEAGVWHQNLLAWIISSFNTLIELSDAAGTASVRYKDLVERWLPKLGHFEDDELIVGWWDGNFDNGPGRRRGRLFAEPDPDESVQRKRQLRIGLRYDFLTWLDWRLVMMRDGDQAYFWQIPAYANLRFAKNHLEGVRIDDHRVPNPNFLRHHDIAHEIWRNQPGRPVLQRVQHKYESQRKMGEIYIWPELEKEIDGLPIEVILAIADELDEIHAKADARIQLQMALKARGRGGSIRGWTFGDAGEAHKARYGMRINRSEDLEVYKQMQRSAVQPHDLAWRCGKIDTQIFFVRSWVRVPELDRSSEGLRRAAQSMFAGGLPPNYVLDALQEIAKEWRRQGAKLTIDWSKFFVQMMTTAEKVLEEHFDSKIVAPYCAEWAIELVREEEMYRKLTG